MKLTKKDPISESFAFEGTKNILILGGIGRLTLERSIRGSDFYPLSLGTNGMVAFFDLNGGCAYNGTLVEHGSDSTYRFVAELESGEVEIIMSRNR